MYKSLHESLKNSYVVVLPLVFLMIFSRFITVIPNFTPTISLIIFLAFLLKEIRLTLFIIVTSQLFADLFIGYYDTMIFVYGTYILIAILSSNYLTSLNSSKILMISIFTPLIFFITTNFGVWLIMDLYDKSLSGLIASYIAGIPFLKSLTISTILFSFTLYVLFKLIKKIKTDLSIQNN